MSNNKGIWGDIVMDDGYVQIPQLLRKNRTKLGLSNNEYTVLIDYIDEWHFTKTTNPYPKLMEYSSLCERSLQNIIKSIENKGLLKREIISEPVLGKTGVKFNLSPLLNKLRTLVKKVSPAGEESYEIPGEESCTTNTKNISTKNINKEKETTKEKESRLQKDFEKFWDTYPRKKSKGNAEKAWKQIKPSPELVEIIINKVVLLKSSQEWLREGGEFIPYPTTWLRAKGWEDEVGPTSVPPAELDDTESAMQEFFTLNHQRAKDEILKDYEDEEDFNRRNAPNVRTGLISQKLWDIWKEIQTVYGTSNPKDLDVLNTVFREEQQVMQTIVDLGLCDEKDIEILNEPTNMKIIQKAVVDYFGEKVARTLLKPQQEKLKRQESADYKTAAKIVKDNLKEFQRHCRKQQALQLWEQKDKDNKTLAV